MDFFLFGSVCKISKMYKHYEVELELRAAFNYAGQHLMRTHLT